MEDSLLKRLAICQRALAKCRGLLYSVRSGDVDVEEIDAILRVTSLEHLAQVLGVTEDELGVDGDELLSIAERLDF